MFKLVSRLQLHSKLSMCAAVPTICRMLSQKNGGVQQLNARSVNSAAAVLKTRLANPAILPLAYTSAPCSPEKTSKNFAVSFHALSRTNHVGHDPAPRPYLVFIETFDGVKSAHSPRREAPIDVGHRTSFATPASELIWPTEGLSFATAGQRCGLLVVNQTTAQTAPCQQTRNSGQMLQ